LNCLTKIQQGLISERGPESPIEKIMFGIPLYEEEATTAEKKRKKKKT